MKYIERLEEAAIKTTQMGLDIGSNPFPLKGELSKDQLRDIVNKCFLLLDDMHVTMASQVAAKCTLVHLNLHKLLFSEFGIRSFITIGDCVFANQNYVYNEMNYELIDSELRSPNVDKTLTAHVWLTLEDGTVLDFTMMPHIDMQYGDADYHLASREPIVVPPSIYSDSNYHRPYLVGLDFLVKTKTIDSSITANIYS